MAAYQSLGQFIATFADPEKAGFRITENGLKPCGKGLKSVGSSTSMDGVPDQTETKTDESLINSRYVILKSKKFWFITLFNVMFFLKCHLSDINC